MDEESAALLQLLEYNAQDRENGKIVSAAEAFAQIDLLDELNEE